MPPDQDRAPRRALRADARDNRRKLIQAARDVLIDRGPAAPLEEIARRAGTGIATLYRHFPDRQALIRDVILDALQATNDEARQAAAEEPDPFRALARYMHRAIDVRTAAGPCLGRAAFADLAPSAWLPRSAGIAAQPTLINGGGYSGKILTDRGILRNGPWFRVSEGKPSE